MEENNELLGTYSRFLDSSGIHLTYSALSLYRNSRNELSDKERVFFTKHLTECTECSAKLGEVVEVESADSGRASADQTGGSAGFRYAMAAILMVAIGVTVLLTMLDPPLHEESGTGDGLTGAEVIDPKRLVPNSILENFVDRTVRSAASLNLIVPGIGDTLEVPFTVRWQGSAENEVTIILVNNANSEIWRGSTRGSEIATSGEFEPGLYYLKIEVDGTLVRVGKFFVLQ